MTKADLKTGMVVELRDGDKYMVLITEKFGVIATNTEGLNSFDSYNDDLTCPYGEDYDIVKVYEPLEPLQAVTLHWKDQTLIWERQEPKEMTVAEIEKELGYSVKVVAGKKEK